MAAHLWRVPELFFPDGPVNDVDSVLQIAYPKKVTFDAQNLNFIR